MKYLESVINSGIFSNLKKSEYIDAFEQMKATGKKFRKGESIFYEGDHIDKICIIESGSVCAEKTHHDGEIHIVEVFEEGSIFGLEIAMSKTRRSSIDFICNEDSVIVLINFNTVMHSDYAEKIHSSLTFKLADNYIRMSNKMAILAERGLRDRIMMYLNILCKKSGSNTVTVRMNREQLAQYLCVNRSALSNELNKMKKEGIIDFKRDEFTIK